MRICLLLVPVLAMAQEVPTGTEISIRLTSAVSTRSSKAAEPVEAVVIAPVLVPPVLVPPVLVPPVLVPPMVVPPMPANGRAVIPSGISVHGTVEKVAQCSAPGQRATLLLTFTSLEIGGASRTMAARVSSVDNAREKVDEQGQIDGILAAETITGRLDAGLDKLSNQYSGFANVLSAAKNAVFHEASTDIVYPRGVEMTLTLTKPLTVPPVRIPAPPAWPAARRKMLVRRISREPFQTTAQRPLAPSDLTNLLLVATEDALRRAFTEAGWSGAASLNPLSKLETLRALAEDRGYGEAPVSVLLLDGKPPDLVFEKTNDTFARRHHLRIWRRPFTLGGKPVWAVAATHDTGISFSEADRTFIHRIDPQIDREREKVVDDLLFTGRVKAFDLVDRPEVPRQTRNATGDSIESDGRIAVLLLD